MKCSYSAFRRSGALTAAVSVIAITSMGCAGTFADPPTKSIRVERPVASNPYKEDGEYSYLSPMMAHLLNSLEAADPKRRWAADTAWRCENRLNSLTAKMRTVARTKSGITITSGTITVIGALTTTILASAAAASTGADKGLDVGTVVAASVTATSGIATLIGSQLEQTDTLQSLYSSSLEHYNTAYELLLRLDTQPDANHTLVYDAALIELNRCAKESVDSAPQASASGPILNLPPAASSGVASGPKDTPPPPPSATVPSVTPVPSAQTKRP